MSKYLILVLLSLLLTACQSNSTPLAAKLPPYLPPDGPNTIAGVPLYPGAVEQKELRSHFANRLSVTYIANADLEQVASTLSQLFIQADFENVKSDPSSKNMVLLVGRKQQVVALLNLSRLNTAGQTVITYTLLLRSPGGS